MSMRIAVFILLSGAFVTPTTLGEVLWDNGLIFAGRGRAISPPNFPDIRVVDDIVVPEGPGWRIEQLQASILEDDEWEHGGITEIYFYDTLDGEPNDLLFDVRAPHERFDTGNEYFSVRQYFYTIPSLSIELHPGTYWLGFRQPEAGGTGTSYWGTSDGGPDGADSSTGFLSFDTGETWVPEGDFWHHGFVVEGRVIPEPAAGVMLMAAGGLLLVFRRPRVNR